MAKGVLGNDPFLRGAAPQSPAPAPEPERKAPPPAKKRPAPRAAKSTSKPRAATKATSGTRTPRAYEAVAHASSPELIPLDVNGGTAHPSSPKLVAVVRPDAPATSATPLAHFPAERAQRRAGRPSALERARALVDRAFDGRRLQEALDGAQGLAKAVGAGLGVTGGRDLDPYGRDASLVAALAPLRSFLYEQYWRVKVAGAERVPTGPVLLVANHGGALPLDGPVLHAALRAERPDLLPSRWLVEDQVFHAPFLGTLLNRLGAVRACPENAVRILGEGHPLFVFPEGSLGTRKPFQERYRLKRFGRGGFIKLALRTGTPIVPVSVVGAEETNPSFFGLPGRWRLFSTAWLPLPARWSIEFGTPLDVGGAGAAEADDPAVVAKLTERTREAIQGMLSGLLERRQRVF